MTKSVEHSNSKLQELLADYLSQNLRDCEEGGKTIGSGSEGESGKEGDKHRRRHKHKSKKKKKKSHRGERDESKSASRSHHRKHRHRREDRSDGEWEVKSNAHSNEGSSRKAEFDIHKISQLAKFKNELQKPKSAHFEAKEDDPLNVSSVSVDTICVPQSSCEEKNTRSENDHESSAERKSIRSELQGNSDVGECTDILFDHEKTTASAIGGTVRDCSFQSNRLVKKEDKTDTSDATTKSLSISSRKKNLSDFFNCELFLPTAVKDVPAVECVFKGVKQEVDSEKGSINLQPGLSSIKTIKVGPNTAATGTVEEFAAVDSTQEMKLCQEKKSQRNYRRKDLSEGLDHLESELSDKSGIFRHNHSSSSFGDERCPSLPKTKSKFDSSVSMASGDKKAVDELSTIRFQPDGLDSHKSSSRTDEKLQVTVGNDIKESGCDENASIVENKDGSLGGHETLLAGQETNESKQVIPEPTKGKRKILIKDLSSCVALKLAEEEKEVNTMEEGEVEDSDDSGAISTCEEQTKISLENKRKKLSRHKKRKRKESDSGRSVSRSDDIDRRLRKKQKHSNVDEKNRGSSFRQKSRSSGTKSPHGEGRNRSPPRRRKKSKSPTRDPKRPRGRSRSPEKSPLRGSRYRGRWRSKSPRRFPPALGDLREKIDKKRLLEIARKNVLQMMQDGTLPSGMSISTLKQEQVIAIKAGGKGVDELTEFCRGLVETGEDENSGNSSDEKAHSDDEGDMPFIHHPFKLRDPQPTIRMNIRNAVQLPTRTPAEKTVDAARLRLQFPVSSGSHHRNKELEWVPVEKSEESTVAKKVKELAVVKPMEPPKVVNPLTQFFAPGPINVVPPLPPAPPPPPPEPVNEVFPAQKKMEMDIASAMLMRVKAVQRLQENPHDVEAMNQMFHAQQQMQQWAQSKLLPGQFGAVGDAKMLTPEELSGPTPVWVKKELFQKAAPLRGGIGMHLLKKMGWNPGEGLGKNKEGSLEPLVLDIKTDKKGLVSTGELPQKTNLPAVKIPRDLSAKHPVSALMELCSKRKWGTPEYTLLDETGPAHRKTFLFKVRVMGTDYQPSVSSYNKKQAKALAASVCLQSMGLLPRNLDKPL